MNRFFIVKMCALIILCRVAIPAQSRRLLAEGDYVLQATTGVKRLSHWKLWRVDDGKYEVVDASVRNPSSIQVFRFDSKFMPIGFSKKMGPFDPPDSRLPKLPGGEITCEYRARELNCVTISGDGKASKETTAAAPPYVVVGEFYDLDFAWFMTGVVHLASRAEARDGVVKVYAITSGKRPTEIKVVPDKPIRIIADGDESALALGRMQHVKKYRVGSDNGRILIGTDQGLIVRYSVGSGAEVGLAIDNYTEYEPWGVPFGDIPGTAASSAPGRK